MGQKVNPISLRLQVNKDWHSRWFVNKRQYAGYLKKDLQARQLIKNKFGLRAAINQVKIERSVSDVRINITTARVGVVVGRGGVGVTELTAALSKLYGSPVKINIEEIKRLELHAQLVAESIANQLERRMSFRRAIKMAAAATIRAKAKGIRIEVAGRLNGIAMSRREREVQGSVPLHTIRINVDYGAARAHYPGAGIIGVKVWINRGEIV